MDYNSRYLTKRKRRKIETTKLKTHNRFRQILQLICLLHYRASQFSTPVPLIANALSRQLVDLFAFESDAIHVQFLNEALLASSQKDKCRDF